jgi:hypothetical protein
LWVPLHSLLLNCIFFSKCVADPAPFASGYSGHIKNLTIGCIMYHLNGNQLPLPPPVTSEWSSPKMPRRKCPLYCKGSGINSSRPNRGTNRTFAWTEYENPRLPAETLFKYLTNHK